MKTLASAALALAAGAFLVFSGAAQARVVGSGHAVTETRALSGFDEIAAEGSIDLVVRPAAQESVAVEGDDNIVPLVETVVEGHVLKVRFKRGESISHRQPLRVRVGVVKLAAIGTAGSGDVRVEGLKTPAFRLALSGSGDATLEGLETEGFEIKISGSGDVSAAGSAKRLKIGIAGSGDARLAALVADEVTVSIAGSGDADVTANRSLAVSVAGSGDVRWGGSATAVQTASAGSGSIRRR